MADLFFRIAQRALGLAPTIQPMIAPLFAPISYTDGEELLDIMTNEEQGSQRSDTAIAHAMSEGDGYLERGIQPGTPANASKGAFVAHQAGIPPISPVERGATIYPEIALQSTQTPVSMPERVVSAQSRYAMPVKNVQMASTMDGRVPRALPVIERQENNQAERRSTPLPLTRVQPLPAIPLSLPFSEQHAPESTRRGAFHDDVRGGREGLSRARLTEQYARESLLESVQTPQVIPAVHVTIGRIEVRAHPVSSTHMQPQRRQVVPKAMSLDEYLKQSEKGGR